MNKLFIRTYEQIARGKLSLFKESPQLLLYPSSSCKFGHIAVISSSDISGDDESSDEDDTGSGTNANKDSNAMFI